MTVRSGQPLVVVVGLEDDALRRRVRQSLQAAGCRVQPFGRRAALADRLLTPDASPALVIVQATWLSGAAPFGPHLLGGPPVLAVGPDGEGPNDDDRPREPTFATARVGVEDGDPDGRRAERIAHVARHLIEQDRRWRGAWISTGLLQLPAPPPAAEPGARERPSSTPPSE